MLYAFKKKGYNKALINIYFSFEFRAVFLTYTIDQRITATLLRYTAHGMS